MGEHRRVAVGRLPIVLHYQMFLDLSMMQHQNYQLLLKKKEN